MNLSTQIFPRRVNACKATLAMLFSHERYLEFALQHNLAVNIDAPDMRTRFDRGEYPPSTWADQAREAAALHAQQLKSGLWRSLVTSAVFFAAGITMAAALGKISPDLPISPGKCISMVGGFLAAWATLFELGGYAETFSGEAIHEIVRPVLFKGIFLPGLTIAALGQLS